MRKNKHSEQAASGLGQSKSLNELQQVLEHSFEDKGLLRRAVTHASGDTKGEGDYQRLEFVGDRVLGLLVSEMLYETYSSDPEGDLAVRLNALVCSDFCAEVAGKLKFSDYMVLSKGESRSGTAVRKAVLADMCEAVIAALYLDGGYDAARHFVEAHWRGPLERMVRPPRDPKTMLQEWAQAQKLGLPRYEEEGREGPDHAPLFKIKVTISGIPPISANGTSKRLAEQAAAEALLTREEVKI